MRKVTAEGGEWKAVQNQLFPNKITSFNIENLETCKKYAFRISAVNKVGSSPFVEVGPIVCAFLVGEFNFSHLLGTRGIGSACSYVINNNCVCVCLIPLNKKLPYWNS